MSDVSEDLEGDVEDFEGDVDVSEWALIDATSEKAADEEEKKLSSGKTSKDVDIQKSAEVVVQRLRSLDSFKTKGKETSDKTSSTAAGNANTLKENSREGRQTSQIKGSRTRSDSLKKDVDSKGTNESLKRPITSEEDSYISKVKKNDDDFDILMAIDAVQSEHVPAEVVEDKDAVIVAGQESKLEEEIVPDLTEDDLRSVDSFLVDEMMDEIRQCNIPQHGDTYTVKFSPVELADLGDNTVHELIKSQPNLSFYLKRQGKFKKKKGYAEVYLTQTGQVQAFVQKLLQIKLVEHRMEVTITASLIKKEPIVVSFIVWLKKNDKLLNLLKTTEDPSKRQPDSQKAKFQIDQVPTSVNRLLLRNVFPYATNVILPSVKEAENSKSEFMGPVSVFYASDKLLEATLDCCTDFSYSGVPLSVQYTQKVKGPEDKAKPLSRSEGELKKDVAAVQERRGSVQEKSKQETARDSSNKAVFDKKSLSGSPSPETTPQDHGVDDDISSMTRDVCSGMIESLNKLKQLGTDNPNILKILEMQNQIASLQQSLSKPKELSQSGSNENAADPWKITSEDLQAEQSQGAGRESGGPEKKLSKEEKRKQGEEERAAKQRKEMDDLQRMMEEADEAQRQQEDKVKRQVELERQKMKELEEQRKANWAKKMLDEAKQVGSKGGISAETKQQAQSLLQAIEERKRKEQEKQVGVAEEKQGCGESVEQLKSGREWDPQGIQQLGTQSFQDAFHSVFDAQAVSSSLSDSPKAVLGSVFNRDEKSGTEGEDESMSDKQEKAEPLSEKKLGVSKDFSPERSLHKGVPVYSEQEYGQLCFRKRPLPEDHYVQVAYYTNRQCPISICPATKIFKTEASFIDHWDVFHTPSVTMRFCQNCTAYFMKISELENHLLNRHEIKDVEVAQKLAKESRMKTVANPSFRDPGKYLPPVVP